MALIEKYINLPLYNSPDYQYTTQIQDVAYMFHFQYNERMKKWVFDIFLEDGSPLLLGECLSPEYPILADYVMPPWGILYLEAIGDNKNETISNDYEIWQYYKLFFIYSEEDGE